MKSHIPSLFHRSIFMLVALLMSLIGSALYVMPIQAASGSFVWAKSMGGRNDDGASHIEVDSAGNIYTTGSFSGSVDFDPGSGTYNLTSAGGGRDIFISKLDNNGDFVWAKNIGSVNVFAEASSLAVDSSGSMYITGNFLYGTLDFDPGPGNYNLTSVGWEDLFIAKLDSNGDFVWAKSISGPDTSSGSSLALDINGNVYITGSFSGTADFDPGLGIYNLTSAGADDILIAKLNGNGDFIWAKSVGGLNGDGGSSLAVDTNGSVYTTGSFSGTVDFDTGSGTYNLTSTGDSDIFIAKLDGNGNFLWAKSMGGVSEEGSSGLAVDVSGSVYTTGYFSGTADFDPGPEANNLTDSGYGDVFVSKLDGNGNFVWAKQMGNHFGGWGSDIAVDSSGNVYTIGTVGQGVNSIFVSQLDSNGNWLWVHRTGHDSSGNSLALDTSVNIYATGNFRYTIDFEPGPGTYNLTSAGGSDIFVSKLKQPDLSPIMVNTALDENPPNSGDGLCTLREAIPNANDDGATYPDCAAGFDADTIRFAGDYTITLVDQQPDITSRIKITGNGTDRTVIQASTCNPVTLPGNCTPATYRVFRVNGGDLTLDQVSVRNGHCDGRCTGRTGYIVDRSSGGAILMAPGGSLTVTNSTFSGNLGAQSGGAIATRIWGGSGELGVYDSTFSGNSAGGGGAISTEYTSLGVSGSLFTDNSAGSGGAIQVFHTFADLTNSTFSRNSASSSGGGLHIRAKNDLTIANSTFFGNSAAYGGGIARIQGGLVLVNSTISGNSATNLGGGIVSAAGEAGEYYIPMKVMNSTITDNSAPNGAGIATEGLTFLGVTSLANTIIANNSSGGNCYGRNINDGNNLDSGDTCDWRLQNGSMSNTDPKLGPLADNGGPTQTHALLPGSPAIDKGNADVCSAEPVNGVDQRGVARPQGAACDIGAYETQSFVLPGTPTFGDVPLNYWAWDFVERLYAAGITGGCSTSPLNYCPEATVTRAQMAVFLLRGINGASYNPPAVGTSTGFGDVATDFWAAAWIKQLASDGITGGCSAGNYCPAGPVTRAQMAIFLLRSKYGAAYTPPAVGTSTGFSDVPVDYWAAAWIKQLVAEGITSGCGAGTYCPEAPVTRAQMAVFLVRMFNLP